LEISAERVAASENAKLVYRLRLRIVNTSEQSCSSRGEALLHSMIAAHGVLTVSGGEFVSLIDPPAELAQFAESCKNLGTWPVLVGNTGSKNCMLSSPIILYDYPQIAPESPGDLFDGGEIDEILSLRILTLAEEEKKQIREGDPRGRELLERTERLSTDDLLRLHGRLRELRRGHNELKPGSRVRLIPKKTSDIYDIALRGMIAVVESVEQDLEGRRHLAVTLEDDPGRDLGKIGQPGHRFFFQVDEVEPL
jgi:hypothetical protein